MKAYKNSIATKFIIYILLFSSITTGVITAMQLYLDYQNGVQSIKNTMNEIKVIYTQSLSDSIWTFNKTQMRLQLEGILKINDIVYADISTDSHTLVALGNDTGKHTITDQIPLSYQFKDKVISLGQLKLVATLDNVYDRLWDKLIITLLGQAGKTFFVSMFIFYIFYQLVAKHLQTISNYLRVYKTQDLSNTSLLKLDRKQNPSTQDELSVVVESINFRLNEIKKTLEDKTLKLEIVNNQLSNQYQDLQKAKIEADRANQSKSMFLSNMSHEIRTPLNVILGYAQILESDKNLEKLHKKSVDSIKVAGNHLLSLINDILDISKIEAGAMKLENKHFDLNETIDSLEKMFKMKCQDKNLNWISDYKIKPKNYYYSDALKIRQILLNILGNACKFTEQGSITFSIIQNDNTFVFTVKDTGPGIPENQLKDIFNPFHQSAAGLDKGGTGLGLAIVNQQVNLLGGELTVDSEEGVGTTFTLKLAFQPSDATIKVSQATHNRIETFTIAHQPIRALVVDDVTANVEVLKYALEAASIQVDTAYSGEEALERIAESKKYDIIFLDIKMPGIDGPEVLKHIRREYSTSELPCIAVSAFSLEHEVSYFLEIGFNKYVNKPFEFDTIYKIIAEELPID